MVCVRVRVCAHFFIYFGKLLFQLDLILDAMNESTRLNGSDHVHDAVEFDVASPCQ